MNTIFWIVIIMIIISLLVIAIFGKKSEDELTDTVFPSPHKGGESIEYASSTVVNLGKKDDGSKVDPKYNPSNSHVGRIHPDIHYGSTLNTDEDTDVVEGVVSAAYMFGDIVSQSQPNDTQYDDGVDVQSIPETYESQDDSSNDNYSSDNSSSSSDD